MIQRCSPLLLLLVGSCSLLNAEKQWQDKLYKAIEASDIKAVERLVKRLDTISAFEKKKLLEAADSAIEQQEKKIDATEDFYKVIAGTPVAIVGMIVTAVGVGNAIKVENKISKNCTHTGNYEGSKPHNDDKTEFNKAIAMSCAGVLVTFLGGYPVVKDLIRWSTAVNLSKKAEAIEALINAIKVTPTKY